MVDRILSRWSGTAARRVRRWVAGSAALAVLAGCSAAEPAPTRSPTPSPTRPGDTAGRSTPVADPVYPARGETGIDVLSYALALRWDPPTRRLSGTAALRIRAVRPLDAVRLDLGRAMRVQRVTVDGSGGADGRVRHDGDKLVVPLPHRLAADARVTLRVVYGGTPTPTPGPSTRRDATLLGVRITRDGGLFSVQEPFGAFTWYPVNDHPSDEAVYDVAITTPTGWAGVSSGAAVGRETARSTVTQRWRETDPLASYVVAFAVDRFVRHDDTGPRGLPITYWVRPADAGTLSTLRHTPEILAWLERRLGPYPFDTAGVVVVPESVGMETQTMITLGPGLPRSVLAHELAHQWFGDSVTPRTWRDVWLNEGFATYLEMLYDVDKENGDQARIVASWQAADSRLRARAGPPGRYDPARFAASNVYIGPALMLHAIRAEIGEERFAGLLREWPARHRNTTQDRASFTAWVNAYTGRDLTGLIDRWLDSPTTPE